VQTAGSQAKLAVKAPRSLLQRAENPGDAHRRYQGMKRTRCGPQGANLGEENAESAVKILKLRTEPRVQQRVRAAEAQKTSHLVCAGSPGVPRTLPYQVAMSLLDFAGVLAKRV